MDQIVTKLQERNNRERVQNTLLIKYLHCIQTSINQEHNRCKLLCRERELHDMLELIHSSTYRCEQAGEDSISYPVKNSFQYEKLQKLRCQSYEQNLTITKLMDKLEKYKDILTRLKKNKATLLSKLDDLEYEVVVNTRKLKQLCNNINTLNQVLYRHNLSNYKPDSKCLNVEVQATGDHTHNPLDEWEML